MCGIVGFFYKNNRNPEKDLIQTMVDTLIHRGPDAKGVYLDDKVALGHRRLSIIDLSTASNQPICNEDKSIWVIFNGEIYNFRELRKKLEAKGHIFNSRGDAEVIVHSYEECGTDVFGKLDGMYAIGIYDKNRRKLILARDRFGKKPLYYTTQGDIFAFASEIKALKKHPELLFEYDITSIAKYFVYDYIPGERTIYKRIFKINPGSFLEIDISNEGFKIKQRRYWCLSFTPKIDIPIYEAKRKLKGLILNAVEKRLISDVPLGVFLSGGIDSSTVLWAIVEIKGAKNVDAFSIGFREKSYDESFYAKKVAEYFGVNFNLKILEIEDLIDLFDKVIDMLDEPFADYSIFPTYLLSRFASEHITVALSGDGGDEFFSGYDTFIALKLSQLVDFLPHLFIGVFRTVGKIFPVSENNMSFGFRLRRFFEGFSAEIGRNYPLRNQVWLGSFNYKNIPIKDGYRDLKFLYDDVLSLNSNCIDLVDRVINSYMKTYLVDDILYKIDQASMFNSLEVRCPFLDKDLVEFLAKLPSDYKLKGIKTKYILKETMKGVLPEFVINRAKKGFGIPVAGWVRRELKDRLEKIIDIYKNTMGDILNMDYINRIILEHTNGKCDYRKEMWSLLILGEIIRKNFFAEQIL